LSAGITEAVRIARRGRRADVKVLCDALDRGTLFIPGAEVEPFSAYALVSHAGRRYCPLFTRREGLRAAAARAGWDNPRIMELDAGAALELARALVAEGRALEGAVIDPFDDHFLELDPEELGHLVARQPIPLERRLAGQPVPVEEPILVSRPSAPTPTALSAALNIFVAANPRIASWRLHQTFNPERERRPRLTLALRLADGGRGDPELAARLLDAIEGLQPPGERLQIIFDAELGA
jgi:SseB protein N-terminal domain